MPTRQSLSTIPLYWASAHLICRFRDITALSIISDVSIQFGTAGYSVGAISAVPEPSSLMLGAVSIVVVGLAALRRRLA